MRWSSGAAVLSLPIFLRPAAVALVGSGPGAVRMSASSPAAAAAAPAVEVGSTANRVASSFQANEFAPRWWARNPHVMTIGGAGVLDTVEPVAYDRQVWDTPDGDQVAVDFLSGQGSQTQDTDVLVVMLHGLESRSNAPLCVRMARSFQRRGYDVAVINFRSCAHDDDVPRSPGGYHLGFTDDVDFVTRQLHAQHPDKRIYLSGFSLGGNVILKFLGEKGDRVSAENGIVGAAVTCVPFVPELGSPRLDTGFNRVVYSGNFLKNLKPKAQKQVDKLGAEAFPPRFDLERVLATTTLGEFDDAFIAPIYGFKDKFEYYRTQGSFSGGFLPKIRVATMALNAVDDPFIDPNTLPQPADMHGAPVRLVYHRFGGHCGFISAQPPVFEQAGAAVPLQPRDWLPEELARFVDHAEAAR